MTKEIFMRIALFLARVLNAYSILIWVRIILSWFVRNVRSNSFTYYIGKMVDPYLSVFKTRKATIGMLDLSPVFAIGLLYCVESLLELFGTLGFITLGAVLSVFLNAFWAYGLSIFFMVLTMALIFKTIASFSSNPVFQQLSWGIGGAAMPVINFVKSFSKNNNMSDKMASIISLVLVIVLWFVVRYLFMWLSGVVLQLPI